MGSEGTPSWLSRFRPDAGIGLAKPAGARRLRSAEGEAGKGAHGVRDPVFDSAVPAAGRRLRNYLFLVRVVLVFTPAISRISKRRSRSSVASSKFRLSAASFMRFSTS